LCAHPKVVAIGEIGLDYYWDTSPKEIQHTVFREQIRLARKLNKPIVIHNRDAHEDIVKLLREERASEELIEEFEWLALESSADFGRVVYDGDEFGFAAFTGSDDELDFLSVPAVLSPEELREALKHRQARQSRRAEHAPAAAHPPALFRTLAEQRTLLHSLVGLQAKRTGQPHGLIHAELRRVCGGPEVSRATVQQLQARIDRLRASLHG
ncbi:MAG: TatD family hydrolase, partial [Microbacteriaceae bacterium]|nr:TatD family hydrolase [Microbacteriaceae bacterium]